MVEPAVKAGDVLIFTEALTHGTHSWKAQHERRSVLFKYSPKHLAWMNPVGAWQEELLAAATERQRRLLEPPYIQARQPIVGDEKPRDAYA